MSFFKTCGLVILLVFCLSGMVVGQNYVEIGDGEITPSAFPVNAAWYYGWSSMLFLQSDLGSAMTIDRVAFWVNNTPDFLMTNQTIYMAHTGISSFPDGSYDDPAGLTQVFSGSIDWSGPGWFIITLDTPFAYNGTDNLKIQWENRHGDSSYSGPQFLATSSSPDNRGKTNTSDNSFPDPDATGMLYPSFPNTRLYFPTSGPDEAADPVPLNNAVSVPVETDLSWSFGLNTDTYDLKFGTDPSILPLVVTDASAGSSGSYTPGTLAFNTVYYWQVITKNLAGESTPGPIWNFTTEPLIDTFPYSEGFEDPLFPPSGWSNPGAYWQLSSYAHTGEYGAKVLYTHPGEAILLTPRIDIPTSALIQFWWMDADYLTRITGQDTTYFEISDNNGATWTTLDSLSARQPMTDYMQASFSLSAYAGSTVRFRWRDVTNGSLSSAGTLLDDILIKSSPTSPEIILSVSNYNFDDTVVNGARSFLLGVTNLGSELTITGVSVNPPFSCNYSGVIPLAGSDVIPIYFNPTETGNFAATVTLNVDGSFTGSNTLNVSGTSYEPYATLNENFDAEMVIPDRWGTIENSADGTSYIAVFNFFAHSNPNAVQMLYAADESPTLIVYSPGVTDFSSMSLSFWARSGYGTVNLDVGILGDPNDASTFTLTETIAVPATYTRYIVDFPNQTGAAHLAFKHSTTTAWDKIYLDDVVWEQLAEPNLTIGDALVFEGDNGTTTIAMTVALSHDPGQDVLVDYATLAYPNPDSTATAGADYNYATGTVTFTTGSRTMTETIEITVLNDTLDEIDERFIVQLSNPVNAVLADNRGIAEIADNDPTPLLSISDLTLAEGHAGVTNARVTVNQQHASSYPITVDFATTDGTALAGEDYTATSGTLTFPAEIIAPQTITIPINGDLAIEPDETFRVNLTNSNHALVSDAEAVVTIQNDDLPALSVNPVTATEGDVNNMLVFEVELNAPSESTVSVNYTTQDLPGGDTSASANLDYLPVSGILSFAGTTRQTVSVTIIGDLLDEYDEEFQLVLSNPVNAQLLSENPALATIVDNDPTPQLSIADVQVEEGNTGNSTATLTVVQTGLSSFIGSVNYETIGNSALPGLDFISTNGTLIFPAGTNASQTIAVSVRGDWEMETDETVIIQMANPVHAELATTSAFLTILNDDLWPREDLNEDGSVNQTDVGILANYIMQGSGLSGDLLLRADFNNDGQVDVLDVLHQVDFILNP